MVTMENIVFVFFDISNDRIRNRVGETCKDFGLNRVQYSGFMGVLTKNQREELYLKLCDEIGDEKASLIIQPVCERCMESALLIGEFKPEKEPPEIVDANTDDLWSNPPGVPFTEDE
jgi:CRISPR-associated protein Cas2